MHDIDSKSQEKKEEEDSPASMIIWMLQFRDSKNIEKKEQRKTDYCNQ